MQDTIATYTLTKDKGFKIAIDRGNFEQGMRAKQAAKVMRIEMSEKIVPMIDADRFATIAAGAEAAGQVITASLDAYEDTLDMGVYLDESKSPLEGRVLFVTPEFYKGIKLAIEKNIEASKYNSELVGKGFVGELDGVPVVKVPSSYFPTGYKALMAHRDAVLGARQITETRIKTDSEFVSGSLLLGRFIFGSFILDAKKYGVAAVKTAVSA